MSETATVAVMADQDLINTLLATAQPAVTKTTHQEVSLQRNRLALSLSLVLQDFTLSIVNGTASGRAHAKPSAAVEWSILGWSGSKLVSARAQPPAIGVDLRAEGAKVMMVPYVRSLALNMHPPDLPGALQPAFGALWRRLMDGLSGMCDTLARAINERLRSSPITVADFSEGVRIPTGNAKTLPVVVRFHTLGFEGSTLTASAEISARPDPRPPA